MSDNSPRKIIITSNVEFAKKFGTWFKVNKLSPNLKYKLFLVSVHDYYISVNIDNQNIHVLVSSLTSVLDCLHRGVTIVETAYKLYLIVHKVPKIIGIIS